MSYFLPSWVQSKVLRFLLSNVVGLDPDIVNLKDFDIKWGRTSTVELRDVRLQIEVRRGSHNAGVPSVAG